MSRHPRNTRPGANRPTADPVCPYCCQLLSAGSSCTVENHAYDYGEEFAYLEPGLEPAERCVDCGVRLGGRHHDHCDIAWCRVCDEQALGCDCTESED